MNNKIVITILMMTFFGVGYVDAKTKKQSQESQSSLVDIIAKLKVQLELTDKQADEIKPIIENYMAQEEKLKLEEKKDLRKVLTSDQMYAWTSLQNEVPREKKKHK